MRGDLHYPSLVPDEFFLSCLSTTPTSTQTSYCWQSSGQPETTGRCVWMTSVLAGHLQAGKQGASLSKARLYQSLSRCLLRSLGFPRASAMLEVIQTTTLHTVSPTARHGAEHKPVKYVRIISLGSEPELGAATRVGRLPAALQVSRKEVEVP